MTLHTTKKHQLIQMESHNITKKPLHEVVDKYNFFFFDLTVFAPVKKSWKAESLFSMWIVPRKTVWNQTCYLLALSWRCWRWGSGERKEGIEGFGVGAEEIKHFAVITSCQFQFQKQIPPSCQEPSTNSHCQNEHVSKVVSFGKGFYDTNKTLRLLTADECGLKKMS